MCLQLASLDRDLGDFFTQLDAMGIDYAVALTADHGGNDLPERQREQAMPMAERLAKSFNPDTIGKAVGTTLGLRSEEHTSELQSLMRISYAVFRLTKNTKTTTHINNAKHKLTINLT